MSPIIFDSHLVISRHATRPSDDMHRLDTGASGVDTAGLPLRVHPSTGSEVRSAKKVPSSGALLPGAVQLCVEDQKV